MDLGTTLLLATFTFILGLTSSIVATNIAKSRETRKELLLGFADWLDETISIVLERSIKIERGDHSDGQLPFGERDASMYLAKVARWRGTMRAKGVGSKELREKLEEFATIRIEWGFLVLQDHYEVKEVSGITFQLAETGKELYQLVAKELVKAPLTIGE